MRIGRGWRAALWATLLLGSAVYAAEADEKAPSKNPYSTAGRFYFWWETGHSEILDDHFAGDVKFNLDGSNGINNPLGGGGGYDIDDHWSVELLGQGTEPDLRSEQFGKIREFSTITIMGGARYRWSLCDGRFVPFLTAGIGYALHDPNDVGKQHFGVELDKESIVGSVGTGFDYFLSPNIAVGLDFRSYIYPDADTHYFVRDQFNRVIIDEHSTMNLTSVNVLAHLKIYPGQPASAPGGKRWFLADVGPFDTDDMRGYLYLTGGHHFYFDDSWGSGTTIKSPGDLNANLGGALGMNFDGHWGAEIQLLNSEPNINFNIFGKIAELSVFSVIPTVRYRWQFLGGRLVPFATAGVGVAFTNINDKRVAQDVFSKGSLKDPDLEIDNTSFTAQIAVGVEYFLNHNLSVGFALPFQYFPDWDTTTTPTGQKPMHSSLNYSGIAAMLQLRAYAP